MTPRRPHRLHLSLPPDVHPADDPLGAGLWSRSIDQRDRARSADHRARDLVGRLGRIALRVAVAAVIWAVSVAGWIG